MDLTSVTSQVSGAIVNLLMVAIITLITSLVGWVTKKIGTANLEKVKSTMEAKSTLVEKGVAFAEQAYSDLGGQEKYQKVLEWVETQAAKVGLSFNDDEIKGLIEAAVNATKVAIKGAG